jgi:hypothetical protein
MPKTDFCVDIERCIRYNICKGKCGKLLKNKKDKADK